MGVSATIAIELELSAGVWTDVTVDVLQDPGIRFTYGIKGNGPLDRVADTGVCEFTLRNDAGNSGGLQGFYSPNHASVRAGFTFGKGARIKITYAGVSYYKWRGKLVDIDPVPGKFGPQRTVCRAADWMDEAAIFEVTGVGQQIDQRSDQLVQAIINSMPVEARPPSSTLDVGRDIYAFGLHDLSGGVKALTPLQKIVQSELGWLTPIGDTVAGGKLRFFNRHARAKAVSAATLNETMRGLGVPTSLDGAFNRVRVVTHPLNVDAAATTVLFSLIVDPVATRPLIRAAESLTLWFEYHDPTNEDLLIGGTAFVDPVVATTDYTMNSLQDGSGTDLTANFTVAVTFFAATAKAVVTNNSGSDGYVTKLQGRGKGIYDIGPTIFEKISAQTYGERAVEVDMPYQDDTAVGQGAADYLHDQYKTSANQINHLEFVANESDTLMVQALAREPGDRITVTETMVGLTGVDVFINGVELVIGSGGFITCRWVLAPSAGQNFWILDDATASILGTTTVLGYV